MDNLSAKKKMADRITLQTNNCAVSFSADSNV